MTRCRSLTSVFLALSLTAACAPADSLEDDVGVDEQGLAAPEQTFATADLAAACTVVINTGKELLVRDLRSGRGGPAAPRTRTTAHGTSGA